MTNRTIKLYGKVYGDPSSPATLTMNFNNQLVFQGACPTSGDPVDLAVSFMSMDVLSTFEIDTAISGATPLTVTVQDGSMIFHTFHANYSGNITETVGNVTTVITPSVDNWDDLTGASTTESDGYDDVQIDGIPSPRNPMTEGEALGKWNYFVPNGSVFTCSVQVKPAKDVPA